MCELKKLESDTTETSSSDEGDADGVLQGLLAQFDLESDSDSFFEEDCTAPARLASLPRIMDDVENEWLEQVHLGPTLSPAVVREVRNLLVQYKDCFAVSYLDLERTLAATFHI